MESIEQKPLPTILDALTDDAACEIMIAESQKLYDATMRDYLLARSYYAVMNDDFSTTPN